MLEGCFANNGTIEAEEFGNFLYTYDMRENNFNARSIQLFSTEAKQKMFDCPNCPYDTYGKFEKYYSAFDYADRWVSLLYCT